MNNCTYGPMYFLYPVGIFKQAEATRLQQQREYLEYVSQTNMGTYLYQLFSKALYTKNKFLFYSAKSSCLATSSLYFLRWENEEMSTPISTMCCKVTYRRISATKTESPTRNLELFNSLSMY